MQIMQMMNLPHEGKMQRKRALQDEDKPKIPLRLTMGPGILTRKNVILHYLFFSLFFFSTLLSV
jgi:hypothetical protein